MNICTIYFGIFVIILHSTQYFVSSRETWQKIKAHGYPLEMHEYQTEDNYMMGMERIPYSKYGNKTVGKPIMLLSGVFTTSIVYVSHNKSLGFILSDAGYDVWLFNYRVTGMSKKVKDPKTGKVPQFSSLNWDFSFHELGIYDLPAAIDLVLSITGYNKVDIGGISLGSTVPLITLSERPEYNAKVRTLVLMGPAARTGSSFRNALFYFIRQDVKIILKTDFIVHYIVFYKDHDNIYLGKLCNLRGFGFICTHILNIVQGFYNPLNKESMVDVFTSFPQPMSVKMIKHYLQLLLSGRFTNFDYGPAENMALYKSLKPPEYNVSRITVPTIILHSKRDNLVTKKDVQWLFDNMPNIRSSLYIDKVPFSHLSFVLGKNTHSIIGPYILNQLSQSP